MATNPNKLASGIMFANEGDNSPAYSGFIEVQADDIGRICEYLRTANKQKDRQGNSVVKLDVSSWRKEGQRGEFLTLAISEAYKKPRTQQAAQAASGEENQDVPF